MLANPQFDSGAVGQRLETPSRRCESKRVRLVGKHTLVRYQRRLVGAAAGCLLGVIVSANGVGAGAQGRPFDQTYRKYADLLGTHVVGTRVDYARMTRSRAALDAVVREIGQVSAAELAGWTESEQIAYWVNAYNVFTLDAIVDHYPIQRRWFSWFTLIPRNSIKQIDGVWTRLRWRAGGDDMTLDELEHETLRVQYDEPRIHFAVNCAAVSCPPLRLEPYVGEQLDRQLSLAAREFLDSELGLQVEGSRLRVSRVFSWYGEDFVPDVRGPDRCRPL